MKYYVTRVLLEEVFHQVEVEADSKEEAGDMAMDIVLGSKTFKDHGDIVSDEIFEIEEADETN